MEIFFVKTFAEQKEDSHTRKNLNNKIDLDIVKIKLKLKPSLRIKILDNKSK